MATILTVDDDPAVLDLLARILRRAGHTVISAVDGQEGFDACLQLAPDLVITGIVMPVMDGHTLCRQLRQHPATRDLPILVISGRSEPHEVAAHYAVGANAFLPKPMPTAALLAAVTTLLAGSAPAAAAAPS